MSPERLLKHFEQISEAPDAVPRLRRFILDLAVRGKLVEQNPADEPAEELLKLIKADKERLVKAGEISEEKPLSPIKDAEIPFGIPRNWKWVRLRDVASYIQRGKSPKYAAGEGPPVVSQKCVQWDGLHLEWAKAITTESLERYEPIRFLQDGDLLWNSTGTGTIGRVIRVERPTNQLVCDSHVTVVRCLLVDERFVGIWLRSDHVYGTVEDRAAGTTNQVELTAAIANNQPTPLPPIAEQHRIVWKVNELMALCAKVEAAQAKREKRRDRLVAATLHGLNNGDASPAPGTRPTFKDSARFYLNHLPRLTTRPEHIHQLRQTILNLAVRGKLVKQDTNDEPAAELLKRIEGQKERLVAGDTRRKQRRLSGIGNVELASKLPKSWQWARVIDIAILRSGIAIEQGDETATGEIPFVKVADLRIEANRCGIVTSSRFIGNKYKDSMISSGSIVFPKRGGAIATNRKRPSIVDIVCDSNLMAMKPFLGEMLAYLQLWFDGFDLWKLNSGTSVPQINNKDIYPLSVPLPPLEEQHRIVRKVDELAALCDQLENQLSSSESGRRQFAEATLYDALSS